MAETPEYLPTTQELQERVQRFAEVHPGVAARLLLILEYWEYCILVGDSAQIKLWAWWALDEFEAGRRDKLLDWWVPDDFERRPRYTSWWEWG